MAMASGSAETSPPVVYVTSVSAIKIASISNGNGVTTGGVAVLT